MNPETPSESLMGSTPEKVTSLHRIFEERGIPYAISGALALGYYRRARGTVDIDVAVFLPPEEKGKIMDALSELFPVPNREEFLRQVDGEPKGYTFWGHTRIDIFFSATPFEISMAERARTVPFNGEEIHIVSAEDLLVCKAAIGRNKDWVDIEDVCKYMGRELDATYIDTWVRAFGEDDSRVSRIAKLIEENS